MRFGAQRAKEIGLVHAVVPISQLDAKVQDYVKEVLSAGPEGVAAAKALIPNVWSRLAVDAMGITADAIAARRVSAEGQEGMKAFLEKRKADWNVS
jgi:methylglutaconyl-CoA hydratase